MALKFLFRVAVVVETSQVDLVDVLHVEDVFQERQMTKHVLRAKSTKNIIRQNINETLKNAHTFFVYNSSVLYHYLNGPK